MHSKCYPIITDFFGAYDAKEVPFDEKWHVFQRLGRQTYLMIQNISGDIKFSPLFIHTFPLLAPHYLLESEKFNIRFPDPSKITETADKLRWYRYRKALGNVILRISYILPKKSSFNLLYHVLGVCTTFFQLYQNITVQ